MKSIVTKVLLLVLAILVKSSIGISIGICNTLLSQSIVIGIDSSFREY